MKKHILLLVLVLASLTESYSTTYYAVASGLWVNPATWSLTRGGAPNAGVPGTGDDVFTDGFNVFAGGVTARNVYVESATASGLIVTGTLTIEGVLAGQSLNKFGFAVDGLDFPTTGIITSGGGTITFTGTALNTDLYGVLNSNEIIAYMNAFVSMPPTDINTVNSVIVSRIGQLPAFTEIYDQDLVFGGNLTISNGTLSTDQMNYLRLSNGILTVSSGATLTLNHGLNENGATSSQINDIIVGGTIIVGSSSYMNSDNLTISSGATLTVSNDQTNGWWDDAAAGPTASINANSTVNYVRGSAQTVSARNYGNLTISSGGAAVTKSLSSTGTLTVEGDLTIGASTTLSTSSNAANIIFQGDITNGGVLTLTRPTIFNGGGTQTVDGASVITFSNTVTFSNAMDFDGDVVFSSTVTAGSNNVSFGEDFTNDGAFSSTGTVTFDGSVAQSITGTSNTSFENLTISNTTSTVTIGGGGTSLEGLLSVSSGAVLATGGILTLVSSATGTASVGDLTGATVTGNVNYERYFADDGTAWRNLGLPISGASTTGITGSGFTLNGLDLARYDEDEIALGTVDDGWELQNSFGTSLSGAEGYTFYTRTAELPRLLSLSGTLNTGNQVMTVTRNTGPVDATNDGWNLVNNPFASTIDWDLVTSNNLDPFAYIYNGSGYTTVGSGGDVSDGHIASGQSFWVHSTTGTPSLTIQEADKVAESTAFFRTAEEEYQDRLVVSLSDGAYNDNTYIWFREGATENFDSNFDALKRSNDVFNLSSYALSGEELAINSMGTLTSCNKTVSLNFDNIDEGTYILDFSGINSFNGLSVTLKDNFSTTSTAINEGSEYSFEVTSDPTSWGNTRFEIEFASVNINADLNYATSNSCDESNVGVTIQNSQAGLEYNLKSGNEVLATAEGNGGATEFIVSKATLSEGTNTFEVVINNTNTLCLDEQVALNPVLLDYTAIVLVSGVTGGNECGSSEVTLSAAGAPEDGYYRWYETIDADESIVGESASKYTTLLIDATKTYFVTVVNVNGCEGERVPVTAVINELPITPQVSTGSACEGGAAGLFATGTTDGNYRWYNSSDLSIAPISGEMNSTFETETAGEYFVSSVNEFGCESDRVMVEAVINELPIAPQVSSGSACKGGAVGLVATGTTDGNYRWYNSSDLSIAPITGEMSSTFETETAGAYFVSSVNEFGCESERVMVEAIINELPIAEIAMDGNILTSNAGEGNQWYKEGVLIEGATSQSYEVVESGSYTLSVDNGNCSNFSNAVELEITSTFGEFEYDKVLIYPNPIGNEDLSIKFGDQVGRFSSAVVVNSQGKTIQTLSVGKTTEGLEIDFNTYENGVYYINLVGVNDEFVYKVLKH
jgi:hypothetical protein